MIINSNKLIAWCGLTLLAGCAEMGNPAINDPALDYSFNFEKYSISADFVYKTHGVSGYAYRTSCAGSYKVTNYGTKNYKSISFKLTFYNANKELVASDTINISGGLIAGGTVSVPASSGRQLTTNDPSKVWMVCPRDTTTANAVISAS